MLTILVDSREQAPYHFDRYPGVNFIWAGNRGGEYCVHAILHRYQRELEKQMDTIRKHSNRCAKEQPVTGVCNVVI